MKKFIIILICLFCIISLGSSKVVDVVVDMNSILQNQNLSSSQKSQLLTQQGEWLLTSDTFYLPYDIFSKALELDPGNSKARLYVSFIKPLLNTRGIFTRLEKLASKSPETLKSLNRIKNKYKEKSPMLYSFLSEPGEIYESEKDLQLTLNDMLSNLFELKKTLEYIRTTSTPILNLNKGVFYREFFDDGGYTYKPLDIDEDTGTNYYSSSDNSISLKDCRVLKSGGVYKLLNCPVLDRRVVRPDNADLDVLDLQLNLMMVATVISTSYDMTGSVDAALQLKARNYSNANEKHRHQAAVLETLVKNDAFGRLLSPTQVKVLSHLGGDTLMSLKTIGKFTKEKCAGANREVYLKRSQERRVFPFICYIGQVPDGQFSLEDNLQGLDSIIQNGSGMLQLFSKVAPHKLEVNFASNNLPVNDLKDLGLKINACGKVQFVNDPTVGGIFPRGDINKVLNWGSPCR